jgi:cell shape-determining protein MreD
MSSWFPANDPRAAAAHAPAYGAEPPAWWHVAVALTVALLVQATLEPLAPLRGTTLSWVLLLVVWYGLRTRAAAGLLFGLIAGSCEDAVAGTSGVAWTFATAVIGFAAGRLGATWPADSRALVAGGVAAATLARFAIFAVIVDAEGRPLPLPLPHLHAILWQALFNALAAFALLQTFPTLGRYGARSR